VKSALSFTVLRRGVWTGHPQDNPTGGKKCAGGGVVELTTIATLDDFDGAAKLRENKDEKIEQGGKCVGFHTQSKCSHKMRAIIKNNQIILAPRNTDNW
jgi:hypothetical protein